MDQEFIAMFETLMDVIEDKCDFSKECYADMKPTTVGTVWKRAKVLLNRTHKRLGSN